MRFITLFIVVFGTFTQVRAEVPQTLVDAMIKWECRGKWAKDPDHAIGDRRLTNKAYGCLQIRQPYVDDVNKRFHTSYKAEGCLGNRELSLWIFQRYMEIYSTRKRLGHDPTFEDIAKIHNGGLNGWKEASTEEYWQGVKKFL